jgi:hypothetical protein
LYLYFNNLKKEVIMKKLLCLFTLLFACIPIFAQTYIPGGSVEGTWLADSSPYIIMGDIEIGDQDVLVIEPGVEVRFNWSYTLYVYGQILAEGAENDSITFTAIDLVAGWKNIRFENTPTGNDTSRFEYCIFMHGKAFGPTPDNCGGAIAMINYGQVIIDHCLFTENEAMEYNGDTPTGGAIALAGSSPLIRNCVFKNNMAYGAGALICYDGSHPIIKDNLFMNNSAHYFSVFGSGYGGAISCYIDSDPEIRGNIFSHNNADLGGGGLALVDNCSPIIENNIICKNNADWGAGIEIQDNSSPILGNNTIVSNNASSVGGGVHFWTDCYAKVINTILWYNTGEQVNIEDDNCSADFFNCNIQGGINLIVGSQYIDEYRDCIDCKPKFADPDMDNYQITWAAWPVADTTRCACIDAGDTDCQDPDGTVCDIGALYFDQTPETPVAYEAINISSSEFTACWSPCEGASEYRLDVACDEAFTNYIYEDFQVYDTMYHVIDVPGTCSPCYYRVRSANDEVTSPNSNIITVILVDLEENSLEGQYRVSTTRQGLLIELLNDKRNNCEVSVYDLLGKQLVRKRLTSTSNYIPLKVNNQVLIITLRAKGRAYSKKLMFWY